MPDSAHDSAGRTPLSGLAQYCLPAAKRDEARRFAWASSVCAVFLVVGLSGVNAPPPQAPAVAKATPEIIPARFVPPPAPPVAEVAAALGLEPAPAPVPAETIPEIVPPVAADPAAVAFAVPVEGRVALLPAPYASPPPAPQPAALPATSAPLGGLAPPALPKPPLCTGAGTSGNYPVPPYPSEALRRRWQGSMLLLVEVAEGGRISAVKVRESSGHAALDQHAADWVRQRWLWPAGAVREFLVPFAFKLE